MFGVLWKTLSFVANREIEHSATQITERLQRLSHMTVAAVALLIQCVRTCIASDCVGDRWRTTH